MTGLVAALAGTLDKDYGLDFRLVRGPTNYTIDPGSTDRWFEFSLVDDIG